MLKNIFSKSISKNYSNETRSIIRLIRSENVGIRTFYALMNIYKTATIALENIKDLAFRGGRQKPIKIYSEEDLESELKKLSSIGANISTYLDADYPPLLKHIHDAPPVINYLGNKELFQNKICAIVGARNASINGRNFAATIAKSISEHGITIASGLARGIDASAHEASLPSTIAVIAGGIDHIYPPENTKLYEKIARDGGVIIAESRVGSAPLAQHFPQRNRIISGLSHIILVVEASFKSGSLITAKRALEQGRDVCAVPGFPLDPRAEGTNRLIKEGAFLVESYHDVLAHFQNERRVFNFNDNKHELFETLECSNDHIDHKQMDEILKLLSSTPISIEEILKYTELSLPVIYRILLALELAGNILRHPGNKYSRIYADCSY